MSSKMPAGSCERKERHVAWAGGRERDGGTHLQGGQVDVVQRAVDVGRSMRHPGCGRSGSRGGGGRVRAARWLRSGDQHLSATRRRAMTRPMTRTPRGRGCELTGRGRATRWLDAPQRIAFGRGWRRRVHRGRRWTATRRRSGRESLGSVRRFSTHCTVAGKGAMSVARPGDTHTHTTHQQQLSVLTIDTLLRPALALAAAGQLVPPPAPSSDSFRNSVHLIHSKKTNPSARLATFHTQSMAEFLVFSKPHKNDSCLPRMQRWGSKNRLPCQLPH